MSFCTVINCMDGRTQLPVNRFLQERFGAEYVDTVTEAGPVRWLAEEQHSDTVASIIARVRVSTDKHGSNGVALVTHYDCAGNPLPRDDQMGQLERALALLRQEFPRVPVIGLWVDDRWAVHEIR
ncbi:MAG: hypothetical protein PVF43_07790 [Candidatus Eiseniibacteriota bacterium]|jgi:hypothetical protein